MLGWFGRKLKIPDGMIELHSPPFDEDGAPCWTAEIENATRRFDSEFLVPVVYETTPGQCLGMLVAQAVYQNPVRTYEGRATLIQRKNDEFRTTIVVTAPSAPDEQVGDYPWDAYNSKYNGSIPKDKIKDIIQVIGQLCEQAHADELRKRQAKDPATVIAAVSESIQRSIELLNAPTDHDLLDQANRAKGHISLAAVSEEYDRLVWQKLHPGGSDCDDDEDDNSIVEEVLGNEPEPLEHLTARPAPRGNSNLVTQGDAFLVRQELEAAIDCYSQAIEQDPTNAELFFKRGTAWSNRYYNRGKDAAHMRAAISDFSHAIDVNPQYGAAFFQRAGDWAQWGMLDNAIADYGRCIELDECPSEFIFMSR